MFGFIGTNCVVHLLGTCQEGLICFRRVLDQLDCFLHLVEDGCQARDEEGGREDQKPASGWLRSGR